MMLGVPEPTLGFVDELPEPEPTLPVTEGEPLPLPLPLSEPTVPVVCGTPALPTPVPTFGVVVVLPGPGPPGTPTPDGLPGWPFAAPPGVLPTLPLDVPVPLSPLLVLPVCANAIVQSAANTVPSTGVRMRIGASLGGSLGQRFPRGSVPALIRMSSGAIAATVRTEKMVRPRGLEPPRVAPLAPQASASTNSATAAAG
jgi:hypothetical protein